MVCVQPFFGSMFLTNILLRKGFVSNLRWAGYVACMGDRRGAYRVLVGDLRERDHLQDLGIDERIILKFISRKLAGGMDWSDLAQDRDRWQALVNAVMNLWVP